MKQYLLKMTTGTYGAYATAAKLAGGDAALGRLIAEIALAGRGHPKLTRLAALRVLFNQRSIAMPKADRGIIRVHVRLPDQLHSRVMAIANSQGRTAADVYREALEAWVAANHDLAVAIATMTGAQYNRELAALGLADQEKEDDKVHDSMV